MTETHLPARGQKMNAPMKTGGGNTRDWWPTGKALHPYDRVYRNEVLPGSCSCGAPVSLIGSPSKGEPFAWVMPGTTIPCDHRWLT